MLSTCRSEPRGRTDELNNFELQKVVEEISSHYFQKPFEHRVKFNPRLQTTGGRYLLRTHNIEINPKYYQKHGFKEIEGIIKHELCHYHLHIAGKGYQHRDEDFKRLSKQTGAPRHCTSLGEKKYRYLYQCTSCEQNYYRVRQMNPTRYLCGKCRGKLKLIPQSEIL